MKPPFHRIDTPIGPLFASFDERGALWELGFEEPRGSSAALRASPALANLARELDEYFAGERTRFEVQLAERGTEFQRAVWRELARIPHGETATYAEIARRIARPKAVRAVGMANHDNPRAIVVPCHRVIGSDGSLTGYAGGLDVKRRLLEIESSTRRASVVNKSQALA